MRLGATLGAGACAALVSLASGQITYLSQSRVITASTTADGQLLQQSSLNVGLFQQSVTASTLFNGPAGPVLNEGTTTIDSDLNPNTIRSAGSCTGAGGEDDMGNDEFGEGDAQMDVVFRIDAPTAFSLTALPRPSLRPEDEFEIELRSLTTADLMIHIDETVPPAHVHEAGFLPAGDYALHFEVEYSNNGPLSTAEYLVEFHVGAGICDHIDFNRDGAYPDTQDIEDMLSVFAGGLCAPPSAPACNTDIDINNDGVWPDAADIEAFLRQLSGGAC